MNNYQGEVRRRSQNLLIVEGCHEKNKLFWLIFKCFPEINIDMDDIWIYGTNIYQLYADIVSEYGEQWAEENEDIDLPFVISRKQYPDRLRYKIDFTNIILVFDYERHDFKFSEEKILKMQRYFSDAADMGKIYINYPMIESYQHLCKLPDDEYAERKIPVSLQPGKKYKALVREETILSSLVEFPHKIDGLLKEEFGISDAEDRKKCCDELLKIAETDNMDKAIYGVLQCLVEENELTTAKHKLTKWIKEQKYVYGHQTYWIYMREIFRQIIEHNICKGNKIQYAMYQIPEGKYREYFERLDLTKILKEQNLVSTDQEKGFIWVLNTGVFFVAEYNFNLIEEMKTV